MVIHRAVPGTRVATQLLNGHRPSSAGENTRWAPAGAAAANAVMPFAASNSYWRTSESISRPTVSLTEDMAKRTDGAGGRGALNRCASGRCRRRNPSRPQLRRSSVAAPAPLVAKESEKIQAQAQNGNDLSIIISVLEISDV